MQERRSASAVFEARPTVEGAGVHLRRVFGFGNERVFDPFLMLDDFRSDDPSEFEAGFPWHPHRGIETITYVLRGDVEHGDSLGNSGVIGSGDVQWMTAGSGIIHQEMPKGDSGHMWGFQLWANLPAHEKRRDPHYRGLTGCEIPIVATAEGAVVRVIAGEVDGVTGPVEGVVIDPEYLDVSVPPGSAFEHAVEPGHTAFAYCIDGEAEFAPGTRLRNYQAVLYSDGDIVRIETVGRPVRFLFLSGRPLREPIAWRGPIVMNTEEELRAAFREYRDGTFVKRGANIAS
ncbi:MAG: pirin family protein [Coriobacteriia bacterium]|nr:pirin family protein [Coriobacteriia bacterium]